MLHPQYDPQTREWFVEYQGQELAAPSLAWLKTKCPGESFKDYCPNGFVAVRGGFLEPSNRKVIISYNKRRVPATPIAVEELPKPVTAKTPPLTPDQLPKELERVRYERYRRPVVHKPKPKELRERVLGLKARGYHAGEICRILNLPIERIQEFIKPREKKGWSDEENAQLKHMAEVKKLTSTDIGKRLGRTKNSVIGQCHRKGYQLSHLSVKHPLFFTQERTRGPSRS